MDPAVKTAIEQIARRGEEHDFPQAVLDLELKASLPLGSLSTGTGFAAA